MWCTDLGTALYWSLASTKWQMPTSPGLCTSWAEASPQMTQCCAAPKAPTVPSTSGESRLLKQGSYVLLCLLSFSGHFGDGNRLLKMFCGVQGLRKGGEPDNSEQSKRLHHPPSGCSHY